MELEKNITDWLTEHSARNISAPYRPMKDQDFIHLQTIQDFHDYVLGIGSLLLCLLSLIGNSLSLAVLLQKDMKSTTYTFLTALAVVDTIVGITGMLMVCLTTFVDGERERLVDDKFLPHIYPLLKPAAVTSVFISIWITVALTTDRYLAVCHGMNETRVLTIPCARRVIIIIFLVSSIYNAPTFFEYEIKYQFFEDLNKTAAVYVSTEFGKNTVYQHIYKSWMLLAFLWGIPILSLAYMNAMLIIAVNHTRKKCKELKQAVPHGHDVTIMLVVVIFMFLICQTPHVICSMLWALQPHLFNQPSFIIFTFTTILLVMLNSSTNFLIYNVFCKKFRQKFAKMFCRSPCHTRMLSHSITSLSSDIKTKNYISNYKMVAATENHESNDRSNKSEDQQTSL